MGVSPAIPLLDAYCTGDTMPCVAPVTIQVARGDRSFTERVRCGSCRPCRIRRKQAWTGRMLLELDAAFGVGRFLTLTYREDPGVLNYRDLQLFLKRYRRDRPDCRFFAVGEYGDKGGRGHWHLIIFGHPQEYMSHLPLPEWPHGFAFDGSAGVESVGYVAGYVLKKTVDQFPSLVRASNRPGIGFGSIEKLAVSSAGSFKSVEAPRWPSSFKTYGKYYPLTDGALVKFKSVFLREGGLPPREDVPELRSLVNRYYVLGDTFLEERRVRDVHRLMEEGRHGSTFRPQRGQF